MYSNDNMYGNDKKRKKEVILFENSIFLLDKAGRNTSRKNF